MSYDEKLDAVREVLVELLDEALQLDEAWDNGEIIATHLEKDSTLPRDKNLYTFGQELLERLRERWNI